MVKTFFDVLDSAYVSEGSQLNRVDCYFNQCLEDARQQKGADAPPN